MALDTADRAQATAWAVSVGREAGLLKVGLEFFTANGPDAVTALDPSRVFLDLKLHDIPATVGGAARAAGRLGPAMLTVHASGGAAMIEAAREALETMAGSRRTILLAVTVLTSLDAAALSTVGVAGGPRQQVLRLGRLAMAAGADGLVCSAREAPLLRSSLGPDMCLVVPGIRPAGASADDQARITTPSEAIRAGADWIVVGRPITASADPGAAARAISAEIARA